MELASDRARGLGFALLSVMAVSPDGILLILMSDHVQPLAVLFWKALVIGAGCLLVAAVHAPGLSALPPLRLSLLLCALQATTIGGFALSVLLTTPARANLLIALNPMWAAVIGVALMRDPLPRRTLGAIALSFLSVCLLFSEGSHKGAALRGSGALGDAIAVTTGCSFAGYMTLLRVVALRHEGADPGLLTSGSFLAAAAVALVASALLGDSVVPAAGLPRPFWCATTLDALLVAAFYALLARASARLTGPEMATVQLLEYVLGPALAWVAGRAPSPPRSTLAGGALLLGGLLLHEALGALAETGHPLGEWCERSSCGERAVAVAPSERREESRPLRTHDGADEPRLSQCASD